MTEKEINEIEMRAVPLNGAPKEDIMVLIDEVRKLRRAIYKNGTYRSITYPNIGRVMLFDWAKAALNETS